MKAQNSQSLFISPAILPLQTEIADVNVNSNTHVMCLWIGILPKNSLDFFPPIYLLPGGSAVRICCSAGDGHVGLILSGRSSEEGMATHL